MLRKLIIYFITDEKKPEKPYTGFPDLPSWGSTS